MAKNKGGKAIKGETDLADVMAVNLAVGEVVNPAVAEPTAIGGAVATDNPAAEATDGIGADVRADLRAKWTAAGANSHFQANGVAYAGGIVNEDKGTVKVLAGSRLVDVIRKSDSESAEKSLANGRDYRDRLVDDGVIEQRDGHCVFVVAHTFPSRSTAATVIGGVVVNGKTAWRDIGDDFGRRPKAPATWDDAKADILALLAKWGKTAADLG